MSPHYWQREYASLPAFADLKVLTLQELEQLVAEGIMLLTPSDLWEFNREYPDSE